MIKPNENTNLENHTEIDNQVDPLVMRGEHSRRVLILIGGIDTQTRRLKSDLQKVERFADTTASAPFQIAIVIFRPRV